MTTHFERVGLLLLVACTPAVDPPPDPEWAALLSLSPEQPAPMPKDLTNRFADDPAAAALGQRLFFEKRFSGRLLESDNDALGQHKGPGLQGEAGKVSCATCHVPDDGFIDTRTQFGQISLAAGWTRRRTPSVLDVGHARLLMWDGRRDTLQRQFLAVFENPVEGNSSRLFLAQQLARLYRAEYTAVFAHDPSPVLGADYPQLTPETTGCVMTLNQSTTPDDRCTGGVLHGVPGDGAEFDGLQQAQKNLVNTIVMNAGKAAAAYERLLTCGPSRFDAYMRGDKTALTDAERRGASLFVGKGQCINCHSGPFFSDQKFYNVGLYPARVGIAFVDYDDQGAAEGLAAAIADPLNSGGAWSDRDDGRLPGSVPEGALSAFRTPMLRCVSQRISFMHTAQLKTLREVVEYFNAGGHVKPGQTFPGVLGTSVIQPLGLTSGEVDALTAFLEALDGPGPAARLRAEPL